MLEIDKYVDDDDFGDLYLDVGGKATCALPEEEKEKEEKLDSPELQEFSDSESEDGLNIVLNDDDVERKSFHGDFEVNGDDFGYENDEVDGMGNDEDAGCGTQFKLTSGVKSNVPAKAAGFSSEQAPGPGFSSGSADTQRWHNFTLPRHRTILDYNTDALDWKPWRLPGADITDYFNFGLDEDSWKSYCNHLNNCRGKKIDVNGYPAYNPSRHTKEDDVGSEHKLLAEVATENTQFIGTLLPFHPKGKAIEVKEGIGERQPSVGVWHPVDRGTSHIIQIALQDSEEEIPTSAKGAVDGKSNSIPESSDIKESGDVAQSEGGIAVCFGSPSEGRLPCIDSVSMLSADCESLQGSVADDCDKLDTLESYSDGSSEAIRSSSDPEEDASGIKPPTATHRKDLGTTDAELNSPNPSSSRSYDSASGYDAYVEADRVQGRSKNDTVKRVYHSSKDSERLGNRRKSGRSENFPISRSPIRRNHTFHRSRSGRSRSPIRRNHAFHRSRYSRSRSPLRRGNKFHQERSSRMAGLKSYPDNQDAWYVFGSDEFHELPHRASGRFTERSIHQGFNHSEREDIWHDNKGSEDFFYRGVKRCEDRLSVDEMDSLHYDYMGEFIAEQLPIPYYRKHTPRNGKLEEMHLMRRRGSMKFTRGRVYKNGYSRENYAGERDAMSHQYDRLLSYPQREAECPIDSSRKFDRVYGNIRSQDWEDHKIRHSGNPFPPSSVKYQNDGRASFPRGDEFGIEDAQMQDRCFERFSESKLCGWDATAFHDDEDVEHFDYRDDIEQYDDQDSFSGIRQCLESEELHGREERHSSWLRDSDFQVNGTSNPVKKSSRGKRFGFVHDHEGKLIGYDYKQNACKRLRKGNNDSQFLQNPNFTQKVIVEQTISGNWKSADKHMVVGNRKSSRCFNGRGSMSNARYEYSDRNVQPGQRFSKDSNKTFKDAKKEDCSDIEEGQIVVKDCDEEHKGGAPCKNPRILEMMAKMEKRQARFKQPLVNVSEKNDCPSTDNVATTMASNTKANRPTRKRKWIAS